MVRVFRKYHRALALIVSLPLILTVLTGMAYTILEDWFEVDGAGEILMGIHTMEILGLGKLYPVLNGIGLVGMLVTGITMTSLFRRRPDAQIGDR